MSTGPQRLRKQYANAKYPNVILRFEDGHEIVINQGVTKVFDAWRGERVKVLAVWDHTSLEREKVETLLGEEFEDAVE